MTVEELMEKLKNENPKARLCVYDEHGDAVDLNRIIVGDNDDDVATEIHLYNDEGDEL